MSMYDKDEKIKELDLTDMDKVAGGKDQLLPPPRPPRSEGTDSDDPSIDVPYTRWPPHHI